MNTMDTSDSKEDGWHVISNNAPQGPITLDTLQSLIEQNVVAAGDLVWHESLSNWTPAKKVKGIFPTLDASLPKEVQHRWFYIIEGKYYGPVSLEELKVLVAAETLSLDDMVCMEGDSECVRVKDSPVYNSSDELTSFLELLFLYSLHAGFIFILFSFITYGTFGEERALMFGGFMAIVAFFYNIIQNS